MLMAKFPEFEKETRYYLEQARSTGSPWSKQNDQAIEYAIQHLPRDLT